MIIPPDSCPDAAHRATAGGCGAAAPPPAAPPVLIQLSLVSPGADADSVKLWADAGCPSTTGDCTNLRQTLTLTGGGADGKSAACEYLWVAVTSVE